MTSISTLSVQLPSSDLRVLRSIGNRLGWKIGRSKRAEKKSELELSIAQAKRGEVNKYASPEEFYKKMGI